MGKKLGEDFQLSDLIDAIASIQTEIKAWRASGDEQLVEAATELESLKARVDEVEAKALDAIEYEGKAAAETKSFAEAVHESDAFKSVWTIERGGTRVVNRQMGSEFKARCEVPSILWLSTEQKAADVILDATLLSRLQPAFRTALVEAKARRIGITGTVPRVPAPGAEDYKFQRETVRGRRGYLHFSATADTLVAALAGQAIPVDKLDHIVTGEQVRVHSTDAVDEGTYIVTVTAKSAETGPGTITVDNSAGAAFNLDSGDSITSEVFGATAESAEKPYMILETENVSVALKMLAILTAMTQQRLNALPTLQAFAETRMRRNFRQVVAWHLLYGDDTQAAQLAGFFSDTTSPQYLWSSGSTGDNRIDAVLRAAEELEGEGHGDLTVIMHPKDWGIIKRLKDDQNNYLAQGGLVQVRVTDGGSIMLDQYRVVLDEVIKRGDFLIKAADASELVDQQSAQFALGMINDDFNRNRVRARYEEMLAHAILDTSAFVRGQWDSAPV